MFTVRDISQTYGFTENQIKGWVYRWKLSRRKTSNKLVFTESEVKEILLLMPAPKTCTTKKFEAVEMHIQGNCVQKISNELYINRDTVRQAIKVYQDTGFIVLESKMNRVL